MEIRIKYEHCPLCGSSSIKNSLVGDCSKHPLYTPTIPKEMQWMDCDDCLHQFVSGYFSDDALALIFQKTQENQKVGYKIEEQRRVSARMVEKVIPYKADGVWLDLGFGNGSLLFTAQEFGFQPIGVDLRKENVDVIKRLGIQAHCDLVENLSFSTKFSVISMMDVLEHIPHPKNVLKSLYANLERDGCALISMPNTENIVWDLMTKQGVNPYLGEMEHYHNFSRTRLYALLKECGLEPVRYGISERYRVCMEVVAIKR